MNAIFYLLGSAIEIYSFLIFLYVILGLLMTFKVINSYNRFVSIVMDFLYKVCEPLLGRIRKFLPDMGGVDLSPLVALLALQALRILIFSDIAPALGVH